MCWCKEPHAITSAQVDEIIRIEDDAMCEAMRLLYDGLKIVAEPACAATTAALTGPLKDQLSGKNTGIVACGSNISLEKFKRLTE